MGLGRKRVEFLRGAQLAVAFPTGKAAKEEKSGSVGALLPELLLRVCAAS
jgi:hypothetical protein